MDRGNKNKYYCLYQMGVSIKRGAKLAKCSLSMMRSKAK